MLSGTCCRECFLVVAVRLRRWATASSSTRFSTVSRPAFLGETCLSASVPGRRSTTASLSGRGDVTGRPSSSASRWSSTKREFCSMLRLFARTKTRRAEKGDPQQRSGSFTWWILDENPCRRRYARAPAPHRDHTGAAARVHGRRTTPRARGRQSRDSGHRLRLRRDSQHDSAARYESSHLRQPHAQAQASPG